MSYRARFVPSIADSTVGHLDPIATEGVLPSDQSGTFSLFCTIYCGWYMSVGLLNLPSLFVGSLTPFLNLCFPTDCRSLRGVLSFENHDRQNRCQFEERVCGIESASFTRYGFSRTSATRRTSEAFPKQLASLLLYVLDKRTVQ